MTRRRTEQCASNLRLDRLIAGELSEADAEPLRAHLAECTPCRTRHGELLVDHQAFAETNLPALTARRVISGARIWLLAGSLAAAAAAWVLFVERPGPDESASAAGDETTSDTRTKGSGLELDWVIRRGSEVFARRPDEPLRPGDALRFSVRVTSAGQVAILSRDGAGRVGVYQDWSSVKPGERQLLPGAVELDGVVGLEHLYALFCPRRWPLPDIERAIVADPQRPRVPPECALERHAVRKELP